jgi:hypothetical protein
MQKTSRDLKYEKYLKDVEELNKAKMYLQHCHSKNQLSLPAK